MITVSWCLRTASAENSVFANEHKLSKARYLKKNVNSKEYIKFIDHSFERKKKKCRKFT